MADRIQEIEARIRLLATTPGPENVTQTLRLLAATAADRRMLDRYAASWLASCHPVDALAVAFTRRQRRRRCLRGAASLSGPRACAQRGGRRRVAGSREVGDVAALEAPPAGLAAPGTVRHRGRPASAQL
jgi:hypothetical protein